MDIKNYEDKLITFAQEAVRTRSYSDEEGAFAELIKKTMEDLKYDEVLIDSVGNVVGRIGNGSICNRYCMRGILRRRES